MPAAPLRNTALPLARRKLPDRTRDRAIHFAGEIDHAGEAGQGFLAFVVVVAEPDPKLVSDGTFLDAADEQSTSFSCKKLASSSGLESSTMIVPSSQSSRSCS